MYQIDFTENALRDIVRLKKSGNKQALKKLALFYVELKNHPQTGTGQVEQLKNYEVKTFSRRINREHRLVYQVYEEIATVVVLSAYGHY
jgi:toxin YoeB